MSSMWAVLIYAVAIGIPLAILYHFGAAHWQWHALAILTALAVGLIPPPMEFQGVLFDAGCGFAFIFLIVWGIGGLFGFRPHQHKHA